MAKYLSRLGGRVPDVPVVVELDDQVADSAHGHVVAHVVEPDLHHVQPQLDLVGRLDPLIAQYVTFEFGGLFECLSVRFLLAVISGKLLRDSEKKPAKFKRDPL